jgi:hypothetical protein
MRPKKIPGSTCLGLVALMSAGLSAQMEAKAANAQTNFHHVLLISVDGMHAIDL